MSDDARVPEDKARQILERAAQIDGRQANLTSIAALRSAAREAGIAPQAFDAAVRELEEAPLASDARLSRRRLLTLGVVGATAVLLGAAFLFGREAPRDVAHVSPPDTPVTIERR
jgi:hypothetical protein